MKKKSSVVVRYDKKTPALNTMRVEFMSEDEITEAFQRATEYPEMMDAVAMLHQARREDAIARGKRAAEDGDAQGCLVALARIGAIDEMMAEVLTRKKDAINPDAKEESEGESEK